MADALGVHVLDALQHLANDARDLYKGSKQEQTLIKGKRRMIKEKKLSSHNSRKIRETKARIFIHVPFSQVYFFCVFQSVLSRERVKKNQPEKGSVSPETKNKGVRHTWAWVWAACGGPATHSRGGGSNF